MMIAETYGHENLHQSLARYFERDGSDCLQMGLNATMTLFCSEVSLSHTCEVMLAWHRVNMSLSTMPFRRHSTFCKRQQTLAVVRMRHGA